MRIFSLEETKSWWRDRGLPATEQGVPAPQQEPRWPTLDFSTELPISRLVPLADLLTQAVGPWESALLWITEWDVWTSSRNLHLFYRLRQSYGEMRLLEEAPGHLFLDYEKADLASFLQITLFNGWDAYLATSHDYARLFIDHDSGAEISAPEENRLEALRPLLNKLSETT